MVGREVVIPYAPRPWARQFHQSKRRWTVLVLHRRAGKTTAALNHLQRDALQTSNSRWAYIAPTYKQAKNIAWDLLKQCSKVIPNISYNESELTVKYPNGSKLTLYGADNPDSLRGIGLWGVVFDEYSQQPSNIFSEIIRPALADHQGYAIWIGTPKGRNEFFRLYEHGKTDEAWLSLLLTVDDTGIIPPDELQDAKRTMTADEFQQEWYCSFEAAIKGAYYATELAEARKQKRVTLVPYDKVLKVHTVWDLGVGPQMAIGFYQRVGREVHKIDYWEGTSDEGIPEAATMLQNKGYLYGKHFAPHDIRAKEIGSGKSRLETAEKLGITFEIVPMLSVDDGIKAAKLMFPRLWIDSEKCAYWLDAIAGYRQVWDDNRGMFLEKPYHDWTSHGADEFRYAAVVEDQMTNEEPKTFQPPARPPQSPYEGGDPSTGKHPIFQGVRVGSMG